MHHGRVIWTYGHYTPPNQQNARLPARVISRLVTSMPSLVLEHTHAVHATGVCMLVMEATNGANVNGGSLTMLFNISISNLWHKAEGKPIHMAYTWASCYWHVTLVSCGFRPFEVILLEGLLQHHPALF